MNAPLKLGVFAVTLVAVFGAGAALGAAFGPDSADDRTDAPTHGTHDEGYALVPASRSLEEGTQELRFQITDPSGRVVTDYDVEHEKELHLIVASRDLGSFEHVHPVRDAAGWWSVVLHDLRPGTSRVYADFAVEDGPSLVLEHELTVPGNAVPRELPAPSTLAEIDGLRVELDAADLAVGDSPATLRVTRGGSPVALQPYLGAGGHLVAIRADDMAYLHVHPTGDALGRGEVQFALEIAEAGPHRLFFDFQVDGVVRTAAFTVDVREAPHGDASDGEAPDEQGHGH